MDDIRQKLADKKEKQLVELRKIEDDIRQGRLERPLGGQGGGQPIPGIDNTKLHCKIHYTELGIFTITAWTSAYSEGHGKK